MAKKKLWAGRFSQGMHEAVELFTSSLQTDQKLWRYDIAGSIAHCRVLGKAGIISPDDEDAIIDGLREILSDIEKGNFSFAAELEDIHMAIEKALIEKIGEPGERLHTGRSRNDQVALGLATKFP